MSAALQVLATVAAEIEEHHVAAETLAAEAVAHAVEAGKLLIEVKAALPHGQFGQWIAANVSVSARQAQRYIAAAQGRKPTTIKSDAVSYLPGDVPTPAPYDPREDEVAELAHTVRTLAAENDALKDRIAAEVMPFSEEEKTVALDTLQELRAEVLRLEIENRALVASRDSYMRDNADMKIQCAMQRKQIEKLQKGGAHG